MHMPPTELCEVNRCYWSKCRKEIKDGEEHIVRYGHEFCCADHLYNVYPYCVAVGPALDKEKKEQKKETEK